MNSVKTFGETSIRLRYEHEHLFTALAISVVTVAGIIVIGTAIGAVIVKRRRARSELNPLLFSFLTKEVNHYSPQMELLEGNVFTGVCLSKVVGVGKITCIIG